HLTLCMCDTSDYMPPSPPLRSFFFNHTATTEIYTLSLHDALPISQPRSIASWRSANMPAVRASGRGVVSRSATRSRSGDESRAIDRKSTRLNSSHVEISYAVFCLKKKKEIKNKPYDEKVIYSKDRR